MIRPGLVVVLLGAAALTLSPPPAGAAPAAVSRPTQAAITDAFDHLVTNTGLASGRTYLQGYDPAMRTDLLGAADHLETEGTAAEKVRVKVGPARLASDSDATVPLAIEVYGTKVPPPYDLHYRAVAVRLGDRWKVSWTTMCLLVEESGTICPATPAGVTAGDDLPAPVGGPLAPVDLTPDLVDPGPLAMGAGGSVLIADDARNQILRWQSGRLTVVAGDAVEGFSGDGGPAAEAELNDPGELAVGPNGTIYFVDRGNERIRAIAVDGVISTVAGNGTAGNTGDAGPATRAEINPSGVAVGPTGTVFVSSGSDIRVVAPDGIIGTRVAGGAPYGADVDVNGALTAFFPESIALDGQGDLVVFSFSPKLLYEVAPDGVVTQVGQDYATALSTTPDGTVLVAQHGPGIERVSGTTMAQVLDLSHIHVPGLDFGLVAEGIAQAPDGTIYVDSEPGDGFSDQTGLYAVTGSTVRPLAVTTPLAATLPAEGGPGFPAALYPPDVPVAHPGAGLAACPSSHGLEPFSPAAEAAARQLAGQWGTGFSVELQGSDRAWWPGVVADFTGSGREGRGTVETVSPAREDLYASTVGHDCGESLVSDSLVIVLGPSAYSTAVSHLYLLNRDGTPLVYFDAY
jgi:hypothetical protein